MTNNAIRLVDCSLDLSYVATEPVSLAEAKTQLYVDFADDDTFIGSLITQARMAIETYCNISILYKTVTATLRNNIDYSNMPDALTWISRWDYGFYGLTPAGQWFELPHGPVQVVLSVTSIDSTGAITLLTNNTDYWVRGTSFKQIKLNTWSDQIIVIYMTGYATCPYDLKLAILNEISFRYEQRGNTTNRYASQDVGASEGSKYLAAKYIRPVL
jgi:hypothetical protein